MESWNPVTAITAEAEESMKVSSPTTRAGQPACGKQGYGSPREDGMSPAESVCSGKCASVYSLVQGRTREDMEGL